MQRYTLLSLVLGALTIVLGMWIALGPGSFEHDLREGFGLEDHRYERERQEFVVFADDHEEEELLVMARGRVLEGTRRGTYYHEDRIAEAMFDGWDVVRDAVQTEAPREHAALVAKARRLLAHNEVPRVPEYRKDYHRYDYFRWDDEREVARLATIVDADLNPRVMVYSSPLGFVDGVRLTGVLAGFALTVLLLVFGPLLAGTQMAQEAHENTLMPLTGTAMRARDLVIGLFAGPMAVIALFAAPQAALLMACSLTTGAPIPALALLAVLLVACFFLSMLTQLIGNAVGKNRTPGVVGIALLSMLGMFMMFGMALGLTVRESTTGVLALAPHAAAFHLIRAALVPPDPLWIRSVAYAADTAMVLGTAGLAVLGLLGARALESRLSGRPGASLTRIQAFTVAGVSTVLVSFANPLARHSYQIEEHFFLNFALLSVPFLVALMMRVPVGDTPPKLRKIPYGAIVGELFGYAALYMIVSAAALGGLSETGIWNPVSLFYLVWSLGTAALLTIRLTAFPAGAAGRVWIMFCGMFTCFAFAHAAAWADGAHGIEQVFVLSKVSPLLGLVQVALTVAIPILLWRTIRPAQEDKKTA